MEVEEWTTVDTPRMAATTSTSSPSIVDNMKTSSSTSKGSSSSPTIEVNVAVFEACCAVLERLLRPQDDDYLDQPLPSDYYDTTSTSTPSGNTSHPSVAAQSAYGNGTAQGMGMVACSPLEWELIGSHDLFTKGELAGTAAEPVDAFLRDREASLEEKTATTPLSNAARQREQKRKSKQEDAARLIAGESVKKVMTVEAKELKRVHRILCKLRASDRSQSGLNGRTHPVNTPCQHILSTHPVNTPYQHILSAHPLIFLLIKPYFSPSNQPKPGQILNMPLTTPYPSLYLPLLSFCL